MRRKFGVEDTEDTALRQLLVYKELGDALKTIDDSIEPGNLIHPVLQGLMLLHNTGLDPTEQAAVWATTGNQLNFPEVRVALRDQWSHERLMRRDRSRHNVYSTEYWPDADHNLPPVP